MAPWCQRSITPTGCGPFPITLFDVPAAHGALTMTPRRSSGHLGVLQHLFGVVSGEPDAPAGQPLASSVLLGQRLAGHLARDAARLLSIDGPRCRPALCPAFGTIASIVTPSTPRLPTGPAAANSRRSSPACSRPRASATCANGSAGKSIVPIRPTDAESKRIIAQADYPGQIYRIDYGNTPLRILFGIQNEPRIIHLLMVDTRTRPTAARTGASAPAWRADQRAVGARR